MLPSISLQDTNFLPNNQPPIPEGMRGAEVEKRLNGQVSFYILLLLGNKVHYLFWSLQASTIKWHYMSHALLLAICN